MPKYNTKVLYRHRLTNELVLMKGKLVSGHGHQVIWDEAQNGAMPQAKVDEYNAQESSKELAKGGRALAAKDLKGKAFSDQKLKKLIRYMAIRWAVDNDIDLDDLDNLETNL